MMLRDALKLIANDGCERTTQGHCWEEPGWTVDAEYLADKWCHPCIAQFALNNKGERLMAMWQADSEVRSDKP